MLKTKKEMTFLSSEWGYVILLLNILEKNVLLESQSLQLPD